MPRMLWFLSGHDDVLREHRDLVQRCFDLAIADSVAGAVREIRMLEPRVLCFDFESPQPQELQVMQDIKRDYPSLPILMLSEAHSEYLAVWAFRARVWNYIVKPVSATELEANLSALATIAMIRGSGRVSHRPAMTSLPMLLPAAPRDSLARKLNPALRLIEIRYAERLRATELARACGLAPGPFSRAFHAQLGVTFRDYLLRFRISHACRRLLQSNVSITRIGNEVGFNDASQFTRLFRRLVGVTPSAYRGGARPAAAAPPSRLAEAFPKQLAIDLVLASLGSDSG